MFSSLNRITQLEDDLKRERRAAEDASSLLADSLATGAALNAMLSDLDKKYTNSVAAVNAATEELDNRIAAGSKQEALLAEALAQQAVTQVNTDLVRRNLFLENTCG